MSKLEFTISKTKKLNKTCSVSWPPMQNKTNNQGMASVPFEIYSSTGPCGQNKDAITLSAMPEILYILYNTVYMI